MRLESDDGDFLMLEREHAEEYDVRLSVSVRRAGFAGVAHVWVGADAWHQFAQELTVLEVQRQGEARVESLSPGELLLVVRALNRQGQLGVEGRVGVRAYDTEVNLQFSVFAFEPSQLVRFAAEAREISADAASPTRR